MNEYDEAAKILNQIAKLVDVLYQCRGDQTAAFSETSELFTLVQPMSEGTYANVISAIRCDAAILGLLNHGA